MNSDDQREVEAGLRASLLAHARNAPNGDDLAERIVATAGGASVRELRPRRRPMRTWALPLVAAAAVVAVAGVLDGLHEAQQPSAPGHPIAIGSTAPASSTPAPEQSSSVASSPPSTDQPATIHETVIGLSDFRVTDTTFVGPNDGWALGTANCLTRAGTCTAMVRTQDGKTWNTVNNPPVNLAGVTGGCTTDCATNIRFANDTIGYVFGPSALFMTTDGGQVWTQESGGAYALETLDGNVIRISAQCLPGCPFTVQIAPIGSSAWQSVALPGAQAAMNSGVTLSRTGSEAFLAIYGHVAGGASNATSVVYASVNDGTTWVRHSDPCDALAQDVLTPGATPEVDTTALTTASDGSVTLLCTPRGDQGSQFTLTSTDAGASFHPGARNALGAAPVSAIGAASAQVLLVANGDTFRSTDAGNLFARVGANGRPSPGDAKWIGFENATTGRAISADGSQIWTTRDAGATWTCYTFS